RRSLPALQESIDLGLGRLAASVVGTDSVVHFRPGAPRKPLHVIRLASPTSCSLLAWGEKFVVPTEIGQVFLFDSESGQQIGSPFQPALSPNTSYHWRTPTLYGSGENSQLLLSDGEKRIYRLALVADPQPHLSAEAEADVGPSPLNTRLSANGELVCAGTKDGGIALYQLPSLKVQPAVDLGAQVVWGPFAVGGTWLMATDTEELVALDARGRIAWRQPLARGPTAGSPLWDGQDLFVLWQQGGLSRIGLAEGKEVGYVALEQPTIAGPVSFGKRLVVSTSDGTLLVVERP
ncbi:MAG: PQQ-binding-like beta-propeller repeat protein, partial [Pirellulales bacterium]|nr:PQQ-binding-like beta-propeller repeat protein [Pirellulales bacterium]